MSRENLEIFRQANLEIKVSVKRGTLTKLNPSSKWAHR